MSKVTNTYRLTASDMQILGGIEVMSHYKSIYGLSTDAASFLTYLEIQALKINRGVKPTAYVATGIKREAGVSLDKLGASASEILVAKATPEELFDAEMEAATYNSLPEHTKLPISRFIGKTWQQVRDEVAGIADRNTVTDVAVNSVKSLPPPDDGDDSAMAAELFGKL